MNITRRRGAIATFITLGVLTVGLAITLNITWIVLNERTVAIAVLGVILFAALIAGVVLNTVFLVREIRRNERQDSFLNAVTHELKTPIASIRLYLETLQRRPVEESQRQEFYKIMLSDSDRLLATVEQVLKAGQLGQRHRQQNRTLIDMQSLVSDCIAITLQRHHLPAETIVLEPTPGIVRLYTQGIAEDLRTAVLNVLDNAVKYSPEGVHIRCSLAISDYTWVALRVTDTGVGLPANQFKRIFTRFYRVPGRAMAKIKGTGLGLFLVRNIARQHGGEATAISPGPGLGTTISITLPLAAPASSAITN
ncbi:sensor histidine kinase [Tunturiibacter gelidoferens]|uniref:Signal transduction histidine kinase n=1 Tax=Tunturiibacter gelidiferens TaxID=3069689 RepID=A0ACC5NXL3_9BACT|nr:HAMP domain-containing sensor histidine kinase [Edaphobacter lichenicola]MBB5339334.1 signal transduction histidine kinase [Edaphobacter lichenicola]